eukprot:1089479-Amorphochlora_amoeboformis.AAC.1
MNNTQQSSCASIRVTSWSQRSGFSRRTQNFTTSSNISRPLPFPGSPRVSNRDFLSNLSKPLLSILLDQIFNINCYGKLATDPDMTCQFRVVANCFHRNEEQMNSIKRRILQDQLRGLRMRNNSSSSEC